MKLNSIIIIILFVSCNQPGQKRISKHVVSTLGNESITDSFIYHFNLLDSAAKANPNEKFILGGSPSILFMEKKTGIMASSDHGTLGVFLFTHNNLQQWHSWYMKSKSIIK